jgi:acetyl-CoA carboxylase biotin carboxyl carrier protein
LSEKRISPKNSAAAKPAKGDSSSPMDVGLLSRLVELMTRHDLNTVDVRDGDRRVILKRGPTGGTVPEARLPTSVAPEASAPAAPAGRPIDAESQYHRITSPMVGTFYAAPKPGEKPFVSIGTTVSEDTDVCVIEAMKTFNNIKAECRGTVARVLAQDGQPVEFGALLFLVKPS